MEPFGSGESLSIVYPALAGRTHAVAAGNDAFDEVFWGSAGPAAKTQTSSSARPDSTASTAPRWTTSKPKEDTKDPATLPLVPEPDGHAAEAFNRQAAAALNQPKSNPVPTQWLASYRVDTGQLTPAVEAFKSPMDVVDQQDAVLGTSEPKISDQTETKADIAPGQDAAALNSLPDVGTILASMTPQRTISAAAFMPPDTGIGHGPAAEPALLGVEGTPALRAALAMAQTAVATLHSAGPGSEEQDATGQPSDPLQAISAAGRQTAPATQSMMPPARGTDFAVMAEPVEAQEKLRQDAATAPVEAASPQSPSGQRPAPHFGVMDGTGNAQMEPKSAPRAVDRLQQARPLGAQAEELKYRPENNLGTDKAALHQRNEAVSAVAPASGGTFQAADAAPLEAVYDAGLTVEPRAESAEPLPAVSTGTSKKHDASGVAKAPTTESRSPNQATSVLPVLGTAPIVSDAVGPASQAAQSVLSSDVETTAVSRSGGKLALEDTVSNSADGSMGLNSTTALEDPTQTGTTKAAAHAAHEVAQSVSRQIASTLMLQHDRPVELTLSPEELGKVRLTLTSAENGITVSIVAERPETLDLMRRNIETLARDFREMGYENTSFSFGQQAQQQRSEPSPYVARDSGGTTPPAPIPALQEPIRLSLNSSTGLDLRF